MKKLLIIILCLILFCVISLLTKFDCGRYQIYAHPTYRADQFLLDTKTGRTWQMTEESKEKYMFWHEIPRDESSAPPQDEK